MSEDFNGETVQRLGRKLSLTIRDELMNTDLTGNQAVLVGAVAVKEALTASLDFIFDHYAGLLDEDDSELYRDAMKRREEEDEEYKTLLQDTFDKVAEDQERLAQAKKQAPAPIEAPDVETDVDG